MNGLYIKILLLIHIMGAIIGLGPTMVFAILGPRAQKAGPNGGVAIMESMVAIERALVFPVAMITQPTSGVLLIFATDLNKGFFSHIWLWVAIILFIGILSLSYGVNNPALHKMIGLAKGGKAMEPEFASLAAKVKRVGPLIMLMFLTVIFLMVMKPGG